MATNSKGLKIPKRVFFVAVDGSADATRALERAVELASEERHDEIIVATVVTPVHSLLATAEKLAELNATEERAATELLGLMRAHAEKSTACRVRTDLLHGDHVTSALMSALRALSPDYLVMGSRGRTLGKMVSSMGSVSAYLLEHAKLPTLVVREWNGDD